MDLPSLALIGFFSLSVFIVIFFSFVCNIGLDPLTFIYLFGTFFYGALELTLMFSARTSVWDLYH
jgi:hypothetical protein